MKTASAEEGCLCCRCGDIGQSFHEDYGLLCIPCSVKETARQQAYQRFLAADVAWMAEIRKSLPGRPGDVRYTKAASGEPGSSLRAAHDEFVAAGDAWRALALKSA